MRVDVGYDTDFYMCCCFNYTLEFRKLVFMFTLKKNYKHSIFIFKPRIFDVQIYCDVIYAEIFRTWRHSLDLTYAQKTRIKSKVIRTKKYKGIPRSVIKGAIKSKIKGMCSRPVALLISGMQKPVFHTIYIENWYNLSKYFWIEMQFVV